MGTRSRSQRGTLASIRKSFSFRSTPPKGVKRSPERRGRTTNASGSRSASNTTRLGSSGITNASASWSVASSTRPISGSASRPGPRRRRSVSGDGTPSPRRRRGPLTSSVTAPILNRCRGAGVASRRRRARCAHARSGARLPSRAAAWRSTSPATSRGSPRSGSIGRMTAPSPVSASRSSSEAAIRSSAPIVARAAVATRTSASGISGPYDAVSHGSSS